MIGDVLLGILIPFFGTAVGAAASLLSGKGKSQAASKALMGFAAGVMLAASIWSLIMPSVELASESGVPPWLPASVGIAAGVASLILLDTLVPSSAQCANGVKKSKLLVLAVTVHNVPEGMAVGAIFAGLIAGSEGITLAAALSLSVGIALQNIPEGAIVGMPLVSAKGKVRAFLAGVMSGAVEPIAALITIALYVIVVAALPYLLAFAAGCMIYVAAKELIPEIEEGYSGVIGLSVGFVLMMMLDLAL